MQQYYLMHKDIRCGKILYDETTGRIAEYTNFKTGYAPFFDTCDTGKIKKWWDIRAVPASRKSIREAIKKSGDLNTTAYLAKNLALSMIDTYWICPESIQLQYEKISLRNLTSYNHGKVPYHNTSSYDYNASLGGTMEKYWDITGDVPVLVKESYKYFGQQSINEAFASRIHDLQKTSVPYVKYSAHSTEDHGILSRCEAFTSDSLELIPAIEVVESEKSSNTLSPYENYIAICVKNGIPEEQIRNYMDYQTMTDFLITNTDEHLVNFGILRNADTMQIIGPAPIYDSGNSMFYSSDRRTPYDRISLLGQTINGFYSTEEKMLSQVKNKSILKLDLLPSLDEVERLYADAGIPEYKASVISAAYGEKYKMLDEFQHGIKISLYAEKHKKQRTDVESDLKSLKKGTDLIAVTGLNCHQKDIYANNLFAKELKSGKYPVESSSLYPLQDIFESKGLVHVVHSFTSSILPKGNKSGVTFISTQNVQSELKSSGYPYSEQQVLLILMDRIKIALANGISVVFDCGNLNKKSEAEIFELAHKYTGDIYINSFIDKKTPVSTNDLIDSHQAPYIIQNIIEVDSDEMIREEYPVNEDIFHTK